MSYTYNHQLQQLSMYLDSILENIDQANSDLDVLTFYQIVLDRLATFLDTKAAALLVRNKGAGFECLAERGFYTQLIRHSCQQSKQGLFAKAARTQKISWLNYSALDLQDTDISKMMDVEGFTSFLAVPVLAANQTLGILEFFGHKPISIEADQKKYLKIISGQLAQVILRREEMQARNEAIIEMENACYEMMSAWVQAVEIRDQYTADHTQRTTDLTLQIAVRMGIPDEMLIHVTRGALLHDIGKLAIPDNILQKPGALTEKEWKLMRRHPLFAYQILEPVKYLRPAIDIPYCHHERWDGSGYPRGLRAENIPLPARIFSVVDVWDALTSDRPYRKAWTEEDTLSYIEDKAGEEFDPDVVNEFLEIMLGNPANTRPVDAVLN